MTLYFFLNEPKIYQSRNKLKGNPRIVKFDPAIFWMRELKTPSPSYATVEELVENDKRFKEFKKQRPSTWRKLTLPENIVEFADMVLSSDYDASQAGRMLLHLVEGSRKSKQFSGIHHLPDPLPHYIKHFKIIEPADKFGVYTASFEILEGNGKILQKENNSTLFPKDWSRQRLYDECLYALNNKVKAETSLCFYRSKTICGIPVEIYFDPEEKNIRTLFPIRTT